MTVLKEDGNRANVERDGIVSIETDDLEKMLLGSPSALTKESLTGEPPKPLLNMAHHALDQDLEELSGMAMGENVLNDEFERAK